MQSFLYIATNKNDETTAKDPNTSNHTLSPHSIHFGSLWPKIIFCKYFASKISHFRLKLHCLRNCCSHNWTRLCSLLHNKNNSTDIAKLIWSMSNTTSILAKMHLNFKMLCYDWYAGQIQTGIYLDCLLILISQLKT